MARDRRRLLPRRGSVPLAVHGLLEYGIGVLLIFSSSLFGFDGEPQGGGHPAGSGRASCSPPSPICRRRSMRRLPIDSHIVLDYVLGVVLVASPFIFGFTDDERCARLLPRRRARLPGPRRITRFKSDRLDSRLRCVE